MERPFLNYQDCCKWCVVQGYPFNTVYTAETIATTQEFLIKNNKKYNNYGKEETK